MTMRKIIRDYNKKAELIFAEQAETANRERYLADEEEQAMDIWRDADAKVSTAKKKLLRAEEAYDLIMDEDTDMALVEAENELEEAEDAVLTAKDAVEKVLLEVEIEETNRRDSRPTPDIVWEKYFEDIKRIQDNDVTPIHDAVNHPSHYKAHPSGVECITITRHMNFNLGNAMKYVWRAGLKESTAGKPIEDLEKAIWYLTDEVKRINGTI